MSKKSDRTSKTVEVGSGKIAEVADRFNREYGGESFDLPEEVQSLPIFQDWVSGALAQKKSSNFWEAERPKKNWNCLDIGCGVSFLIYPWWEWNAFFYGQEISSVAKDALDSRAPQLNSKLYKGVNLCPAHRLNYEENFFDLAIATGFSCYYDLDYWCDVLGQVKKVLKPDSWFVFDVVNPDSKLAEDWEILESYLGTEVFLEAIADWEKMIKATGVKKMSRQEGELFDLYKVRW